MTSKHGTDSRRQSGEHNDALKRFREKMKLTLERYPAYDTDFSLERWLQAYDDIGKFLSCLTTIVAVVFGIFDSLISYKTFLMWQFQGVLQIMGEDVIA